MALSKDVKTGFTSRLFHVPHIPHIHNPHGFNQPCDVLFVERETPGIKGVVISEGGITTTLYQDDIEFYVPRRHTRSSDMRLNDVFIWEPNHEPREICKVMEIKDGILHLANFHTFTMTGHTISVSSGKLHDGSQAHMVINSRNIKSFIIHNELVPSTAHISLDAEKYQKIVKSITFAGTVEEFGTEDGGRFVKNRYIIGNDPSHEKGLDQKYFTITIWK